MCAHAQNVGTWVCSDKFYLVLFSKPLTKLQLPELSSSWEGLKWIRVIASMNNKDVTHNHKVCGWQSSVCVSVWVSFRHCLFLTAVNETRPLWIWYGQYSMKYDLSVHINLDWLCVCETYKYVCLYWYWSFLNSILNTSIQHVFFCDYIWALSPEAVSPVRWA